MKSKIITKLKKAEGKIRGIIGMVEGKSPDEEIIIQINNTLKLLKEIEKMILKNHLIEILTQTGLPKEKFLKYYNLIGQN